MSAFDACFGDLADPRAGNASYRLSDLMVVMVAASLCGATTATEFALFADTRQAVLARLVRYRRPPSHDTFSRVLRLLKPAALEQAFGVFAQAFAQAATRTGREVVALDGKALRRAYERGQAAQPPIMVSAFAAGLRLCLAASAPKPGENEIEAALRVVDMIDLTGRIITADALHCHHRMAQAVVDQGGDYLLALKGNRRSWLVAARAAFAAAPAGLAAACSQDRLHDRHEVRSAQVIAAPTALTVGHAAFVRIIASRDGARPATRFFLASTLLEPADALAMARSHWQIENALHWVLDVHLNEDAGRARKDNAPANQALLTRIARNILQSADGPKVPISHRIRKCAWNDTYLFNAITHMQ